MLDFYYLHICLKMGGGQTEISWRDCGVHCSPLHSESWLETHLWNSHVTRAWTSALSPPKRTEKGTGQSPISLSPNRPWFQTAHFHRYIQYFAVFLDRDSFLPTWQRKSSQKPGETGAGSCWELASLAEAGSAWKSPRPHSWSKHSASVTFESTFPTSRPRLWVDYLIYSNAWRIT